MVYYVPLTYLAIPLGGLRSSESVLLTFPDTGLLAVFHIIQQFFLPSECILIFIFKTTRFPNIIPLWAKITPHWINGYYSINEWMHSAANELYLHLIVHHTYWQTFIYYKSFSSSCWKEDLLSPWSVQATAHLFNYSFWRRALVKHLNIDLDHIQNTKW